MKKVLLITLTLLMIPTFAMGKGYRGVCKPRGQWWQSPRVTSQMQLTDKQIQELNKKYVKYQKKITDYEAKLIKTELELKPLLLEDKINANKIDRKLDKIRKYSNKIEEAKDDWFICMRNTISKDQYMNACKRFGQKSRKHRKKQTL